MTDWLMTLIGADSCATVICRCRHGARCEHGRCVCPQQCPPESGEAVCASDGRSYDSECEMRLAACQRSVDLDVVSRAPCDRDDIFSGSGSGSGSGDGKLTPLHRVNFSDFSESTI